MNTRKQISLKEELKIHHAIEFNHDQLFTGKSRTQIQREMQEQFELMELLDFYETMNF